MTPAGTGLGTTYVKGHCPLAVIANHMVSLVSCLSTAIFFFFIDVFPFRILFMQHIYQDFLFNSDRIPIILFTINDYFGRKKNTRRERRFLGREIFRKKIFSFSFLTLWWFDDSPRNIRERRRRGKEEEGHGAQDEGREKEGGWR